MFAAVVIISAWHDNSYRTPSQHGCYERLREERIVLAPSKRELYQKLRAHGMGPAQISRVVREIPPSGIDAGVREWDRYGHRTLWECDPSQ